MKILFSGRPAFGHMYPLLALAVSARDAGHVVELATAEPFTTRAAALGIRTHRVGLTLDEARRQLDPAHAGGDGLPVGEDGRPDLEAAGRLFVDIFGRATVADLEPVLAALDVDLVVYEQGEFGAALAAHAAGIPAVCRTLSPRLPDELIATIWGPRLEQLWSDHGMVSPTAGLAYRDLQLDPFPTALQLPSFLADPTRIPVRPLAFAEPTAARPAWLGETSRPLVYLTLGTVVADDDVLRPAIDGLASLDVDVLVALGSADGRRLGALPSNVHVEAFVDQPAVLRHAALAVHHGGSGTVLAAIAAGTPQVLLPKGADQFLNADTMVAAGLAAALEPAEATPSSVAALARDALGRELPAAARAREELAARPGPRDVLAQVAARLDLDARESAA